MDIPSIQKRLMGSLSKERFEHTLNVVEIVKELAGLHNVDERKAELAALLHDCAKEFTEEDCQKYWEEARVAMEDDEKECEGVWHAYIGALYARDELGVDDDMVLNAIRRHSVGDKEMSDLDAVTYIADACAPRDKEHQAQRDVMLEIARKDLWKGVLAVCTFKMGLGEEKSTVPLRRGERLREWVEEKVAGDLQR